jgi:biotin carboxylase
MRIGIVGGREAAIRKARAAGLDVVWFHSPAELDRSLVPPGCEVHRVDFRNLAQLLSVARAAHERAPFGRLVALTEGGLLPSGYVRQRLGIPGNSLETVELLSDKLAFRERLAVGGGGDVRARLGDSRDDLARFVAEVGATIIKPRAGSGSVAVRAVDDPADVPAAYAWAAELGLLPFLMEERLMGPEVSVETVSQDGRHHVVAVTAKETGQGFVEYGHVVPAPLAAEPIAAVHALVQQVLDAVGLREGPAHTEVVLTSDGPRVVESHDRRGGDRINDLVAHALGVDIDEAAFATYAGADLRDVLARAPRPAGAAAVRFLTARAGRVTAVDGVGEAGTCRGVLEVDIAVRPGDLVHPVMWSEDRVGLVIATGRDAEDARACAAAAASRVRITTIPVEGTDRVRPLAALVPDPRAVLDGTGARPGPAHRAVHPAAGAPRS